MLSFIHGSSPLASRKWSHVDNALNLLLFTTRCDEDASEKSGVLRVCDALSEGRREEDSDVALDKEDEGLRRLITALESVL